MRLRRSSAPSSPGFLHASASARICRFSLAENRRRLAVATTSGSGARPAAGAAPSLAVRAPCGAAPASELICMSIKEEPIPLSVMSAPAGTLNGPRQMSRLRLARGASASRTLIVRGVIQQGDSLEIIDHDRSGYATSVP